jgi:hypothetical protein
MTDRPFVIFPSEQVWRPIVQQRSQSKRSHAHAKRHAATAYLGLSDHGV